MLNSAACRSKTARAPARSSCCSKSSSGESLMQGRGLRCRRAYEISRYGSHGGHRCQVEAGAGNNSTSNNHGCC